MEALVIALAVVAVILIVLWLLRWYQRRDANGGTARADGGESPILVVVDIPQGERVSLVAALEHHLDEAIRTGAGAARSMVPPPSAGEAGREQVVITTRDGPRTLDAVLRELQKREFRVEATEGRTVSLASEAGAEATVLVRRAGREVG